MKKRNLVLALVSVSVLIVGGASFYAYKKVKNLNFDKLLKEKVLAKYPRLDFQYKELATQWGWTISLRLSDFLAKDKEGKLKDLARGKSLDIEVPWWAIFSESGTVTVSLRDSLLEFQSLAKDSNNWSTILKEKEPAKEKNQTKEKESKVSSVLGGGIIAKMGVSLSLENITLKTMALDKSINEINFQSLSLEDLSLAGKSPYQAKVKIQSSSNIKLALESDGEIENLLLKKQIKLNGNLNLVNIHYPGYKVPNIQGKLNLAYLIDKAEAEGSYNAKLNKLGSLNIRFKNNVEGLMLNSLKLRANLAPILNNESLKKLPLSLQGKVDLRGAKARPDLKISLYDKLQMHSETIGDIFLSELEGKVAGDLVNANGRGELLKGEYNFKIKGFYPEEKRNIGVDFQGNDLIFEKIKLNPDGKIKVYRNSLIANPISIRVLNGKISGKAGLGDIERQIGNFDLRLRKLSLSPLKVFVQKYFSDLQGELNGVARGSFSNGKKLNYGVNFDVNVLNGNFKGVDFTQKVNNIVSGINAYKPGALKEFSPDLSEGFKNLQLAGSLNPYLANLSKIFYLDKNSSSFFEGGGKVYLLGTKKKSQVDMIYSEKSLEKRKKLEDKFGSATLPVVFKGMETNLKPDYSAIIKDLGKNLLKKEAEKLIEKNKIKEKIKSKVEDEAKKLLKGLFK